MHALCGASDSFSTDSGGTRGAYDDLNVCTKGNEALAYLPAMYFYRVAPLLGFEMF